jgi:RNA polymerase sigma-70 factor (ECF subfamily)
MAFASKEPIPDSIEQEVVELFDRFRVPLLRYLVSFRIAPPDAEEIVQEAFLLLYRHLQQGKSRSNLAGWLFGTAHRLALRLRSASTKRAEAFQRDEDPETAVDRESLVPDERLELIERRQRLLAVVSALPEVDRQCLSLRAEGLRYREISEVLGVSLGSVANALGRALERLIRVAEF